MATPNRSAILTKAHKVLKQHYEPQVPPADRSLLEHVLYSCCLENARYEDADQSFARLTEAYFDWNEVRVTSIAELSEVLSSHPSPSSAALRVKQSLHSIFESQYSFDLDTLKKENIGVACKKLANYHGVNDFTVAYVTQHALGGHAIPVDNATIFTLVVIGAATEAEAKNRSVPGLDRAIPKNKGIEFASLLHEFAAELAAAPQSAKLRGIATDIAADAKERLPKRTSKSGEGEASAKPKKRSASRSGSERRKRDAAEQGKDPATKGKKAKSTTRKLTRKKPR